MKRPCPVTCDFETEGIDARPAYPPKPVGISIKYPGKQARYYAFGHPTNNNCTEAQAKAAARKAWGWKDGILCQNAKFDVDVAETHWQLKPPAWNRIEDTMFLLFLDDPHQLELSLKPSAERLLGRPPDEQEAVRDWLLEHQPVPGVRISAAKNSDHYWGRYICLAPGDLVGEYANGDTERTEDLFVLLWPKTQARGMGTAYDRERRLMPILLEMERTGVPVNRKRLAADVALYQGWLAKLNAWVLKRLHADASLNLDSGEQLVEAMLAAGKADPDKMLRTPTGKYQTNKAALLIGVTDAVLLAVLKYRAQLKTCLGTFMEPWLATATASGGLIFTSWNQVKAPKGDHNQGTRTGRLSSTPNFQNIPLVFKPIFAHDLPAAARKEAGLPKCPFPGLPRLPRVRSYVEPFAGKVLVDRDYSQQEPRILAHFDGATIMERYLANPWMDFHDQVREELARIGLHYERKLVKNTGLGLIYGMGVGMLAERNGTSVPESKALKAAILSLLPGLKAMYQDMKARARDGVPIRTWGGREYYCEPPKLVDGKMRKFDYKLVNVLIQGSAADATKEAIIRFHAAKRKSWRLLLNVHDQLTCSAPKRELKACMETMRRCMESVEFDVALLSEGSTSPTNWAELKPYDKKGVVLPFVAPARAGSRSAKKAA